MKLYYIVQTEMLSGGVMEAQVVAALRAQSRIPGQPPTKLLFLEPARVAFGAKAKGLLAALRRAWPEGRMAVVPYVGRLGRKAPGLSLASFLAHERLLGSDIVFHCRGALATWSAHVASRALGKGRVIFDLRGPAADETIHRLGHSWPENLPPDVARAYEYHTMVERRAVSVADRVFTVSDGLKRYAVERLGAEEGRVTVVPSCVESLTYDESARRAARREWGVGGDAPVFLYSGRLGLERDPLHMFRIFRAVLDLRPDAKLGMFSYLNQLGDLGGLLAKTGVPESSVFVRSYTRDEVMACLCGADVGMIFCEPALRYKDWFPIKFPEYLSAGLSVAMNSLVGNLPGLVRERSLGWVVDATHSDGEVCEAARRMVDEIANGRDELRRRSLDACTDLYLWRNFVPTIRRTYGELAD